MRKPDISKDSHHHRKLKQVLYFPGCTLKVPATAVTGALGPQDPNSFLSPSCPWLLTFPHPRTKQYSKGRGKTWGKRWDIYFSWTGSNQKRATNPFSFENYVLWLSSQHPQSWLPSTVPRVLHSEHTLTTLYYHCGFVLRWTELQGLYHHSPYHSPFPYVYWIWSSLLLGNG